MKKSGIALVAIVVLVGPQDTAYAQMGNACKVCSDQQRACMKNYGGPTCKTEFQMCMKSCKAPNK